MATDEELRALERAVESDPSAWSKLAFAYERLGRHADALDAAIKAGAQSASEPARELLTPRRPTAMLARAIPLHTVPWRGLRTFSRVRVLSLLRDDRTSTVEVLDGGRGIALVSRGNDLLAYDVLRDGVLWTATGVSPLGVIPGGLAALRTIDVGQEPVLVDTMSGEARSIDRSRLRLARAFDLDGRAALVPEGSLGYSLVDLRSSEHLHRFVIDEGRVNALATDLRGFTVAYEGFPQPWVESHGRDGVQRWGPSRVRRLLGAADGSCFVERDGATRVLSLLTGGEEGVLSPERLTLQVVLEDVLVFEGEELIALERGTFDERWVISPPHGAHLAATADALLLENGRVITSLDPETGETLASLELERRHRLGPAVLIAGKAVFPVRGRGVCLVVVD